MHENMNPQMTSFTTEAVYYSYLSGQHSESTNNSALAVGIAVLVIVVVILLAAAGALLFVMRKRRRTIAAAQDTPKQGEKYVELDETRDSKTS